MAARHSAVGLNHPTVVPATPTDIDETDEHPVRCPACGQPLAEHE